MAAKVVTYDLNRETVRPAITKKLKETCPNWAMLSESCYAVETALSNQAVYDALKPILDDNDALFVFDLKMPIVGAGPDEVVAWIHRNVA